MDIDEAYRIGIGVLSVIITLYLVRHDKKLDRIEEKLENKVSLIIMDKVISKLDTKVDKESLLDIKRELTNGCNDKRLQCYPAICDKINEIKEMMLEGSKKMGKEFYSHSHIPGLPPESEVFHKKNF